MTKKDTLLGALVLAAVAATTPAEAFTLSRYIPGRLVCARNVNAALAVNGIRGTGSALARSFLSWGRPSGPVPGAVAVFSRRGGGHVAIVSRVTNGRVYLYNASGRRGWKEIALYKTPLAYRSAL